MHARGRLALLFAGTCLLVTHRAATAEVPASSSSFGSISAADWQVSGAAAVGGSLSTWNGLDIVYRAILSLFGMSPPLTLPIPEPGGWTLALFAVVGLFFLAPQGRRLIISPSSSVLE